MTKRNFQSYLWAVTMNSLQIFIVLAATVYGSVGAGRVVVFLSWVTLFLSGIGLIYVVDQTTSAMPQQLKVLLLPGKKLMTRITDILSVILLIFYGFWISGIVLYLATIFNEGIWNTLEEKLGIRP